VVDQAAGGARRGGSSGWWGSVWACQACGLREFELMEVLIPQCGSSVCVVAE
jgi:hypothetical protein